ncbi:MAG: hypothetical protein AAF480_05510 [Actinomycetota bacterium]
MDQHEHESEERGLPVQHVLTDTSDRTTALLWAGASAAFFGALAVVALVVADPPLWLLIALGALGLVALIVAWARVRVWAGWANPQLFMPSSAPLNLGDRVVARVRRAARGRADLAGLTVTAEVIVLERVRHGGSWEPAEQIVYRAPAEVTLIDGNARVVEADIALEIPLAEAPPSLDLSHNEVVWELLVDMRAPNAPDDLSTFAIDVAPQVADRLQRGGAGR